jgi:hypothetical protein
MIDPSKILPDSSLDSLSLVDLAQYVAVADDRRRTSDRILERFCELVDEIDAAASLCLGKRTRADRPRACNMASGDAARSGERGRNSL